MAATHIVTIHNFRINHTATAFANSAEEANVIAERLYDLGDRDVFISEVKSRKYGKRGK